MSGKDLGFLVTLAVLLFTMAVSWQKSQDARDALERRIDVLEHIEVSEHPAYSPVIFQR